MARLRALWTRARYRNDFVLGSHVVWCGMDGDRISLDEMTLRNILIRIDPLLTYAEERTIEVPAREIAAAIGDATHPIHSPWPGGSPPRRGATGGDRAATPDRRTRGRSERRPHDAPPGSAECLGMDQDPLHQSGSRDRNVVTTVKRAAPYGPLLRVRTEKSRRKTMAEAGRSKPRTGARSLLRWRPRAGTRPNPARTPRPDRFA